MNPERCKLFEIIKWITPVILFFLGLYFNKMSERIRENRRLKVLERYFASQLELLDQQITIEIDELNKCLAKLKNWDSTSIILNQTPNKIADKILAISHQDLFSVFIYRKKGDMSKNTKCYNSILANTDYFATIFPYLLDANKKTINELNNCYEIWNEIQFSISDLHNYSISSTQIQDPFFIEMNRIIMEFNASYKESQNFQKIIENKIQPLKELCKKNSENEISKKLMPLCDKASFEFSQIKAFRESHLNFIELTKKDIEESELELRNSFIEFENTKTKKLFKM